MHTSIRATPLALAALALMAAAGAHAQQPAGNDQADEKGILAQPGKPDGDYTPV